MKTVPNEHQILIQAKDKSITPIRIEEHAPEPPITIDGNTGDLIKHIDK